MLLIVTDIPLNQYYTELKELQASTILQHLTVIMKIDNRNYPRNSKNVAQTKVTINLKKKLYKNTRTLRIKMSFIVLVYDNYLKVSNILLMEENTKSIYLKTENS